MKKFKLKNKIISIFGAVIMFGAFCASIFSGVDIFNSNNFVANHEQSYAYDSNSYKSYADSVIATIEAANTASMETSYTLKDYYPILAENQTNSNLCWAYAGSKVLETTLMHAKAEYYNFSEIAVAYLSYKNGLNTTINSFGSFEEFDRTIRESGIVHESDFSNDIYFKINETNQEAFSYVTDYADKNLASEVVPIYLSNNENFKNSNKKESIIKYYIKNYGALNIALPAGSMFRYSNYGDWAFEYNKTSANEGKNLNENHAVCLIGWNSRGFIGLNSWGVDISNSYEEVLIPYDVMDKYYSGEILFQGSTNDYWLAGYYYVGGESVSIEATSADEFSATIIEENLNSLKNVFCSTEPISITYKLKNVSNFDNVYVRIYKNAGEVSSVFDIAYNEDNKITISWSPKSTNFLPTSTNFIGNNGSYFFGGGTYIVHIYEDVNLVSTESFTVFTGTEVSYVQFESTLDSDYGTYYSNMNTMSSANGSYTYYINHSSGYEVNMYLTDINKLSNVSGVEASTLYFVSDFSVYDDESNEYVSGDVSTSGLIGLGNGSTSGNCYSFSLSVDSDYAGKLVRYQINIFSPYYTNVIQQYTFEFFVSSVPKASANNNAYDVIYVLDGGKNDARNIDIYPQYAKDVMTEFTLYAPEKSGGYEFVAWYTDAEFTNLLEDSLISNELRGDLVLYAKWRYDDTLYYTTNLKATKIYNYKDTIGTDVDLSNIATLTYGESIKLQATFNITDELKAKTFSFKYYYYINGKKVDEAEIITTADMGNVLSVYTADFGGIDDENLAFPHLQAGQYHIEIVAVAAIKHEFSITENVQFGITVNKKQVDLKYDVAASTLTYDKEAHLPSVVFDSSTYFVEDKEQFDKVLFNEEAQSDAATYEYTVVDINNSNYELNAEQKVQNYRLYINKKLLTLDWTNNSAVYNGKEQKPIPKINGTLQNDKVVITLSGPTAINAGTYSFMVATISSSNYYIQEAQQVEFVIKPAPLTVVFNDIEERAQKAIAYRTKPTFTVQGTLYDSIESLNIKALSDGLTSTESDEYAIIGTYNNSNYDISFVPGSYVLTGYYYINYILPNGEIYQELVNYGETPKGIPEDVYKVSGLKRIKYDKDLTETGDDIYIEVMVVDYSWYVIIGVGVVGFVAAYLFISRKARRNKVR